jgi:hypothetical protein
MGARATWHDTNRRQGVALDIEQSDAVHLLMAAAEAEAETGKRGIGTEPSRPKIQK